MLRDTLYLSDPPPQKYIPLADEKKRHIPTEGHSTIYLTTIQIF